MRNIRTSLASITCCSDYTLLPTVYPTGAPSVTPLVFAALPLLVERSPALCSNTRKKCARFSCDGSARTEVWQATRADGTASQNVTELPLLLHTPPGVPLLPAESVDRQWLCQALPSNKSSLKQARQTKHRLRLLLCLVIAVVDRLARSRVFVLYAATLPFLHEPRSLAQSDVLSVLLYLPAGSSCTARTCLLHRHLLRSVWTRFKL